MGPTVAQNTEPVGLNRGVLYLWVKSSSWMQQLTFMKDPILDTLNKKLGRPMIKNIRFTLDRREVPGEAQAQKDFKNVISKIAPENDED